MKRDEVLLSDYSDSEKDFYIRRMAGSERASHFHHHDYYQMYYILKGALRHEIGGVSTVISKGDVFILPPNIEHRAITETQAEIIAFSFTEDFIMSIIEPNGDTDRFLRFLSGCRTDGSRRLRLKLSVPSEQREYIEVVFKRLFEEYREKKAGYRDVIKYALASVLAVLARLYTDKPMNLRNLVAFEKRRSQMQQVEEYINENISSEELTTDELAKMVYMSRSMFCSEFKNYFGMSLGKYLSEKRIETAIRLLRESDMDITEIMYCCGYRDSGSFYRNFKEITGTSPKKMRET